MRIREFLQSDSAVVSSWVLSKEELYRWSADIIGVWPLEIDTLYRHYEKGMAEKSIVPLIALDDEEKIFGHCFLRFPSEDRTFVRIGFVIVDPEFRSKGYGRKLIQLAEEYAKEKFKAKKFSLGVYTNNLKAMNCYLSMNFIPDGRISDFECPCGKWKVMEMIKEVGDSGILYRKATACDIDEIQAFVDKAKTVMDRQGIPQWDEIYPTGDDFAFDAEKNELYVGMVEGKAAVCFTLNKNQDEEYLKAEWENSGDDFIVIHRLCVNPEFQGKGIGIKTCRFIEGLVWCMGNSSIKLDAFTQNPISLAMYEKLDYRTRGYADWRKGRFKLMEKVLDF
ncbi:MAG: GNAT family N-acetyltransferase [Treponema sp.]|nr:GNAT family N-acetyltransferase [Candidatus Treponema equifaecale]